MIRHSMSTSNAHHILSERVRTSRKMGADSSFVLHGGGNTSAKGTIKDIHGDDLDVLFIKGSGWDLATIEAPGFPACDLKALRSLRSVEAMDDETMVREVRRTMLDPSGPTPSVETTPARLLASSVRRPQPRRCDHRPV